MLVEVDKAGEEAREVAAELILSEVCEDGISVEVEGLEGGVVGGKLADRLGSGYLVLLQIKDAQLEKPVQAFNFTYFVTPQVQLLQHRAPP